MSCRLLNQIFRVAQTNHFQPVLKKIMLNAFPNNNSILKNTTTSFYTILTSNIYKNHNLAKQKTVLKASARLQSDISCNKLSKKAKVCKPKKKTPKLKYTEIRICQSENKCKEKMICICMPISKFKEMRSKSKLNKEESREITELKKCPTVLCPKGTQSFCWVPPQKKPCPVRTWILGGPPKVCGLPFYAKAIKSSTVDRKSSQPGYVMKPGSSTNCIPAKKASPTTYCAPSKQPSPISYCAPQPKHPPKKTGSGNNCVPSKQPGSITCAQPKQPKSTNMCAPPKQQGATNMCSAPKQPGSINSGVPTKQQGASNIGAQPKQLNSKTLKN